MAEFTKGALLNTFGPNPLCARGESFPLNAHPNGHKLIYPSGRSVVIRDVNKPEETDVYTEHKARVTVAKFSRDGKYVCSGDANGTVHVWEFESPDKKLVKEIPCLPGKVLDVAWSNDNKRICAGGDGKSNNSRVFIWNTGSQQGELSGATKPVLSVDIRPTTPSTLVTASDMKTFMFKGPPYKFLTSQAPHTNFVQCIRFSPDGSKFATVSNDSMVYLYDAESGDKIGELPKEHKGSIYSCSWHSDSDRLVTASGDKTCKVWSVSKKKCLETFVINARPTVGDMQTACVFAGDQILSVSLNGNINYLDIKSPGAPTQIVQANTTVPACVRYDWINGNGVLYSGDTNGDVVFYTMDGRGLRVAGPAHAGPIVKMCVTKGKVYSIGMDDYLRAIDPKTQEFIAAAVSLGAQPVGVAASLKHPDLVAVATANTIILIRGMKVVDQFSLEGKYDAKSISMSPGGSEVVVGGSDSAAHVYKVSKDKISDAAKEFRGCQGWAQAVAHSPNGKFVAVGDRTKEITLWDRKSGKCVVNNKWVFHTAGITDLEFSPNSAYLASSSVDSAAIIWNVEKPLAKSQLRFAHTHCCFSVTWMDDKTVVTSGGDSCVRIFSPQLPK